MTFPVQVATRVAATPKHILALASLRYDAVRTLSPEQFAALNRSALTTQERDETFADSFDRIVDLVIATNAAMEKP